MIINIESEHPEKKKKKMNNSEFLEMIGATKVSRDDKLRPTGAGLLMFGKEYKILYASITYFRLKVGDQVTVIIPANNDEASWAAVEANI